MERFSVNMLDSNQQGCPWGPGWKWERGNNGTTPGLGRWQGWTSGSRGSWAVAALSAVGRCGHQQAQGALQSGGRPQAPGSGGFTLGLDVCLGSPGALALASAWFPNGQKTRPAHLKVISLGPILFSYFQAVTCSHVWRGRHFINLLSPAHPTHLPSPLHQSLPKTHQSPKSRADKGPFLPSLINIYKIWVLFL